MKKSIKSDNSREGNSSAGSQPIDEDVVYSADPSERRLVVVMSPTGVKAYLKHNSDATAGYRALIDAEWSRDDAQLLRRIENAVYDHPEVLDDYECDVVVITDSFMWMPEKVSCEEDVSAEIFTSLYTVDFEDILQESVDYNNHEGLAILFTLCPGLPAFLRRTFPGARVSCQQSQLFRRFAARHLDASAAYVDLRDDRLDILVFRGDEFRMGAVHPFGNDAEAEYHILNCLREAGVDAAKSEVYLSGNRELRQILLNNLRESLPYVRNAMLPRIDAPGDMPTPALICATQPRTSTAFNSDDDENNQR